MNLEEAYNHLKASCLTLIPKSSRALEARLLLKHFTKIQDYDFIINSQQVIQTNLLSTVFQAAKKRNAGYPLAYIKGYKDFWKHRFIVNESVLIPRPDTECLIESCLSLFPNKSTSLNFIDVGIGSGNIALSLLKEYTNSSAFGVDISSKALNVAQINAKNLQVLDRILLINQNLLSNFKAIQKFDFIISNPPYITINSPLIASNVDKYEPNIALYADEKGLYYYRNIINQAQFLIKSTGYIIFEIGIYQESQVIRLAQKEGLTLVKSIKDLSNISRVLVFSK